MMGKGTNQVCFIGAVNKEFPIFRNIKISETEH